MVILHLLYKKNHTKLTTENIKIEMISNNPFTRKPILAKAPYTFNDLFTLLN